MKCNTIMKVFSMYNIKDNHSLYELCYDTSIELYFRILSFNDLFFSDYFFLFLLFNAIRYIKENNQTVKLFIFVYLKSTNKKFKTRYMQNIIHSNDETYYVFKATINDHL